MNSKKPSRPPPHRPPRPAAPLDDGDAFIPDSRHGHVELKDDEAEAFAEEYLAAATSAEMVAEDARDEVAADELGGPFLETTLEAEMEGDETEIPTEPA